MEKRPLRQSTASVGLAMGMLFSQANTAEAQQTPEEPAVIENDMATVMQTYSNCDELCISVLGENFASQELVYDADSDVAQVTVEATVLKANSNIVVDISEWSQALGADENRVRLLNMVPASQDSASLANGDRIYFPHDLKTQDNGDQDDPAEPAVPQADSTPGNLTAEGAYSEYMEGPNSENYWELLDSLTGSYIFSGNTPRRSRCGAREVLETIISVSEQWTQIEEYQNETLVIGDLTEADGHNTHERGADVDITTLNRLAANIYNDPSFTQEEKVKASFELAKLFALSGKVRNILYNGKNAGRSFNQWAIDNNVRDDEGNLVEMIFYNNHDDHFHVNFLHSLEGQKSAKCAVCVECATQELSATIDPQETTADIETNQLNTDSLISYNGEDVETTKFIIQYMLNAGMTVKGASFMTGNLITESTLSPIAIGDGGDSIGVAQWDEWRRGHGPFPFPYGDLHRQLDFLILEIQMNEKFNNSWLVYTDPNATLEQLSWANFNYEVYGVKGERDIWGADILNKLSQ